MLDKVSFSWVRTSKVQQDLEFFFFYISGFSCYWHNVFNLLEFEMVLNKSFVVSSSSSRPEVFCKKGVITNFAKLTGK